MSESSTDLFETARNLESDILRRIASKSQKAIALDLGVDEATISRWLHPETGILRRAAQLLASLNLRVKDASERDFRESEVAALETLAMELLFQRRKEREARQQ